MADEGGLREGENIDEAAKEKFGDTHPLACLRAVVRLYGADAPKMAAQKNAPKVAAQLVTIVPTAGDFKRIKDYLTELKAAQLQDWQRYLEYGTSTLTPADRPT